MSVFYKLSVTDICCQFIHIFIAIALSIETHVLNGVERVIGKNSVIAVGILTGAKNAGDGI